MFVTIGICTFNRAESLRRTLNSLVAMRVPNGITWEVVVVNNNSTDYTDDLIDEYIGRLPVRHEFEPRPGKSIAPNRAIDVAKGDFIIWIVIHDHNFPSNTVRNSHRYKRIEGSTQ